MIALLALGFAAFVVFAVVSALLGVAAFVFWVVLLPFRLLGFAFKALGALLFLPAMLIGGLLLAAIVGIPLLFRARTRSTVSMMLAPGWRNSTTITEGLPSVTP